MRETDSTSLRHARTLVAVALLLGPICIASAARAADFAPDPAPVASWQPDAAPVAQAPAAAPAHVVTAAPTAVVTRAAAAPRQTTRHAARARHAHARPAAVVATRRRLPFGTLPMIPATLPATAAHDAVPVTVALGMAAFVILSGAFVAAAARAALR